MEARSCNPHLVKGGDFFASSSFLASSSFAFVIQASSRSRWPHPYRLSLVKCEKPIVIKGRAFGCGQCLPCLFNRRRIWTHRLILEAHQHEQNAFLTLTYDNEHMPKLGSAYGKFSELGTLIPKHLQDFLKRFRKAIEPSKIRFYACGEYGDATERPHYHAIIFGFTTCLHGRTRRVLNTQRADWRRCCPQCQLVGNVWGLGDVDLGTVEVDSCQYVAGYVVKKMTRTDDARLNGRWPEFSRMSNRPGIGADALHEVASELMRFNLDNTQADVPSALRHGKRELPLGRYLTRRLRKLTGKDEQAPAETLLKIEAEVQDVRKTAFDNSESFSSALQKANAGKVASFKARSNIFKTRKSI